MNENDRIHLFCNTRAATEISTDALNWLIDNGFFKAPASTKYHGNYEGGLFDHSFEVMNALVELTEKNGLTWQRERSPYIVGIFHDLCKIDQYKHPFVVKDLLGTKVEDTHAWEYRSDTLLKGHGDKSVMLLSQLLRLTEEEVLCIRYHMGAFVEREEWNDYTRAIHRYPNVLWTHQADMIASHVKGV
jgi:hypothetical protein